MQFPTVLFFTIPFSKPNRTRGALRVFRRIFVGFVGFGFALPASAAETAAEIDKRLATSIEFLASDDREGRGIGTKGLEDSAAYIADQFRSIGLSTELLPSGAFQPFLVTTSATLGPVNENRLELTGPDRSKLAKDAERRTSVTLELETDFQPLAAGGSNTIDVPLVFAGYGITAEKNGYDDYASIDTSGKCVIVLRHQPFRGNPHGPFEKDPSRHAFFQTKIANALAHGASALLFCTGEHEIEQQVTSRQRRWQAAVDKLSQANTRFKRMARHSEEAIGKHRKQVTRLAQQIQTLSQQIDAERDPVLSLFRAGTDGGKREMPIFHCRRSVLNQVLTAALGKDLSALEREIDKTGKPASQDLPGWQAIGQTRIDRKQVEIKNVVAVLEGEGPRAKETIVLGAHYDHLGTGGRGSLDPGSSAIHNGADDNGSGIAALLEIARRIVALDRKLPRRLVFIAFSGEERGLLGSAHYIKHPAVPLEDTIAMLNFDMVGRLRDNKLIVSGTETAEEFDTIIKRLNAQHDFSLVKKPSGYGPSDHQSFYEKKIPVLHFFTGSHQDYHRPTDDVEKINITGLRRISALAADTAVTLAESDGRPTYHATKRPKIAGGRWPYFGSRPDYAYEKPGIRMAGVVPDGPAERGGVREGDVIVRFGKAKVATVADFASALSRHKAGDQVPVVVERQGKQVTVTVTLDPPRR